MSRKSMVALVLALIILLALPLAACRRQDPPVGGNDGTTRPEDPTTEVTDPPKEAENFNPTGYPIVNEKMTFRIMIPGPEMDFNEKEYWREISEKTNVFIEWDNPSYAIMEERKQLMLASGDFVDALGGWILSAADVTKYGSMGVFLPLQDMIEQYTVNIRASLEAFPKARSILTLPDGNIYTLPIIGKQPPTRATTLINKEWLERIGRDMPTTTDELLEVLRLFKTEDPNENGIADEIPLSFNYKGGGNNDHAGMFGWFGFIDMAWPEPHLIQVDREVMWAPTTDGFKDAIGFFAQLWDEGLLDKEVFTHDASMYSAKLHADPHIVGVYSYWSAVGAGTDGWREYAYLPPLRSPNGNKPAWPDGDTWVFRMQAAITTAANQDGKEARALMRYLDEIYLKGTLDGTALNPLFHGPEGVGWEITPEGKFRGLDANETAPDWQSRWGGLPGWPWYQPFSIWENWERDERGILKDFVSGEVFGPYQGQQLPPLWLSAEQSEELAGIRTDIEKVTEERTAAWITGRGNVDTDFEQFVQDIRRMGLDRLLEVYQSLLDAYYAAS